MRITSLKLENFRTYKEKTPLEDLKGLNIFIGPNNSGKSNVVHALRILRDLASASVSLLTPDIFRKEINENDIDGEIMIEVVIDLSDSERKALMKSLGGDHLVNELPEKSILRRVRYLVKLNQYGTIHEELSILNNRNEYSDIIINSKERKGTTRTTNLKEIIQDANSTDAFDILILGEASTWLPEWIMLKTTDQDKPLEYVVAELIKGYFRTILHLDKLKERDYPREFFSGLETFRNNYLEQFMAIATAVKKTLGFTNLSFSGNRLNIKEDKRTKITPFGTLSDGSKDLLYVMSRIAESTLSSKIICIEEPETHLHSLLQKTLMQKFKEISKENHIQFFITTHSPLFTSIENDNNTFLVQRDNKYSEVISITNGSQLRLIKQHLGIDNTDIYLSPYVLFVEGESEEIAVPIVAKALNYHNIGKEIRVINIEGTGKTKRLKEFVKYIIEFDTEPILLLDGHNGNKDCVDDLKRFHYKFHPIIRDKEFEDLFPDSLIVRTMKALSANEGFLFELNENQVSVERQSSNISNILQRYMYNKNGRDFDKPKFARKISDLIVHDIKFNSNRNTTKFEEEIKDIMNYASQ